jgi:hypothetical protein
MYISQEDRPAELKALTDQFSARIGAAFLKSRALNALLPELEKAHHVGLTWKELWEALKECGYTGSYRQFAAMTRKLTSPVQNSRSFTKNLTPAYVEKETPKPVASNGATTRRTKEKPEWQIQREQQMAKLDRDAEQNRQRELELEAKLKPKKIFIPSVFVGRSED